MKSGSVRAPHARAGAESLAGVRIVTRSAKHLPEIAAGLNSGVVATTTMYRFPRTSSALLTGPSSRSFREFTIIVDSRVAGVCSLWPPRFAGTELTIAIFNPTCRGRGIGTFAVRSLCDVAFDELGLGRVELSVYPHNATAIRCYEKAGFVREALLRRWLYNDGAWRDAFWMARTKS